MRGRVLPFLPSFSGVAAAIALYASIGGSAARSPASLAWNPDQGDSEVPIACLGRDDILERGCSHFTARDRECTNETFASIKGSCFYETSDERIPEILDPSTRIFDAAWLSAYPIDRIAKNLVYRIYLLRERKAAEKYFGDNAYPFFHRIDYHLAFNDRLFEAILKDGFMNAHQVRSRGSAYVNLRVQYESEMIDMDLRPALASNFDQLIRLLPKYSHAAQSAEATNLGSHFYTMTYGNLLAVLDDDVRNRATFTPMDSFVNHVEALHTLKLPRITPDLGGGGGYFEGQVWGTLGLRNVKYFIANCPKAAPISLERIRRISMLSNLPVYSCKWMMVNGGQYFRPDALLARPSHGKSAPKK